MAELMFVKNKKYKVNQDSPRHSNKEGFYVHAEGEDSILSTSELYKYNNFKDLFIVKTKYLIEAEED